MAFYKRPFLKCHKTQIDSYTNRNYSSKCIDGGQVESTVPLYQAGAAYRSAFGHNPPSPAG